MADSLYTMDNEVFSNLMFYGTLLMIKVFLMAPLTSRYRSRSKTFANPEDVMFAGSAARSKDPDKTKRMLVPNDDVERVS